MIYPTGTITIEELQSIKLPVVNFAEGYKVAEVDVFLGKCADTLRNGYGLSAEEVERHSFTSTYMGGYAIGDVDLLLDRIAWTLKNRPSGVYASTTAQPCTQPMPGQYQASPQSPFTVPAQSQAQPAPQCSMPQYPVQQPTALSDLLSKAKKNAEKFADDNDLEGKLETGKSKAKEALSKARNATQALGESVSRAKEKNPDEYELAVIDYNLAYSEMNASGNNLLLSREKSVELIGYVTRLVNSIANTPKSFEQDFEEIRIAKAEFSDASEYAERNCRRLVIPLQAQLQELLRESRWPALHPQPQCGWPRRSGQRPPAPRFPLYPVPPQPMQRSHGLVAELLPLVAQAWPVAVRSLRWRDLWAGPSRVRRCSRPSYCLRKRSTISMRKNMVIFSPCKRTPMSCVN